MACSKEAATLGAKVAVFDFVKPSPYGSVWGLGGTCVNVGCIPKKLMHQASIIGEMMRDGPAFGWDCPAIHHHWNTLVNNVQDHIRSLNYGYAISLKDKHVEYKNQYCKILNKNQVEGTDIMGNKVKYTCKNIVIAVGGRPSKLDCEGGDLVISSDDIFMLDHPPGKTLVVGASFIALECAGFLKLLGFDVTVMVRSILLRGFDRECAEKIGEYEEEEGIKFIKETIPSKIEKLSNGRLKVFYTKNGNEYSEEFDTVLSAIGRYAVTKDIGLEELGIKLERNGKIKCEHEQTNIDNIYGIGDVLYEKQELTPVAIMAGKLLARRLFGNSKIEMDYEKIPVTVFTPLEYGSCGLTEETAIQRYGQDNIEVFISNFTPLEWTITSKRPKNKCFAKMICNRNDDMRLLGIHILSPNAGEIVQGYAICLKMNGTYNDINSLVGIHPTIAEEFTTMEITKRSGVSAEKGGC